MKPCTTKNVERDQHIYVSLKQVVLLHARINIFLEANGMCNWNETFKLKFHIRNIFSKMCFFLIHHKYHVNSKYFWELYLTLRNFFCRANIFNL